MSDIKFSCISCVGHLLVEERGAGLNVICPHCGHLNVVPAKTTLSTNGPALSRVTTSSNSMAGEPKPPIEQPSIAPREMFSGSTSILMYRSNNRQKLDAQLKLNRAMIDQPEYPSIKTFVLKQAHVAADYEWLVVKTGTWDAQVAFSEIVKRSTFDALFERLFPGQPWNILWPDRFAANWSPPGESITAEGNRRFAAIKDDILSGKYQVEEVICKE